jgi:hypothetical protein
MARARAAARGAASPGSPSACGCATRRVAVAVDGAGQERREPVGFFLGQVQCHPGEMGRAAGAGKISGGRPDRRPPVWANPLRRPGSRGEGGGVPCGGATAIRCGSGRGSRHQGGGVIGAAAVPQLTTQAKRIHCYIRVNAPPTAQRKPSAINAKGTQNRELNSHALCSTRGTRCTSSKEALRVKKLSAVSAYKAHLAFSKS